MVGIFFLSFSTRHIGYAPREKASRAHVAEPENKSKKECPVKSPNIAKTDSRNLSILGRISPGGNSVRLFVSVPPVILRITSFNY